MIVSSSLNAIVLVLCFFSMLFKSVCAYCLPDGFDKAILDSASVVGSHLSNPDCACYQGIAKPTGFGWPVPEVTGERLPDWYISSIPLVCGEVARNTANTMITRIEQATIIPR